MGGFFVARCRTETAAASVAKFRAADHGALQVLIVSSSDQDGVAFAGRFGYGDCRTTETGAREIDVCQVLAADGERNLKGANKADLLLKTFPGGFIYAGDSASDLAVWAHAAGVITVNVRKAVRTAAARLGRPTLHLPDRAAAAKS